MGVPQMLTDTISRQMGITLFWNSSVRARQLARLGLGIYITNVSRRGRNVLWSTVTTNVAVGGSHREPSFAVRDEQARW